MSVEILTIEPKLDHGAVFLNFSTASAGTCSVALLISVP